MLKNTYGSVVLKPSESGSFGKPKGKMKDERQPLLDSEGQSDYEAPGSNRPGGLRAGGGKTTSVNMENVVDDRTDPIYQRLIDNPTSNTDTMIHLLKGNIGTGILAMPDAFRNSGLLVGLFGTFFLGTICTLCMHMLVGCAHELCRRRKSAQALSFAEVAELSFEYGPRATRHWAKGFRDLINIFLCITQLGFCCVYFVFVSANLHDVIKYYFIDINVIWYMLLMLIPMILLNWVKKLKYLTPASLFATILTVCGLGITFYYMFRELPATSNVKLFSSWNQLPLFFGTAIFAFEGIGVVLPLENNMKTPQDFGGWNGVLNTGMVIVTCLYAAEGFFGYLKYGESAVLGSITLLLPPGDWLAQCVRVMMATAIFLSYCLQFYVPMNIIWPIIKKRLHTDQAQFYGEYATRTGLVILTFALAAAIPNLGAVISLVGAFSSSALALIFPPIIDTVVFWEDCIGKKKWILVKNIFIVLIGLAGFTFGTYASLMNIWNGQTASS